MPEDGLKAGDRSKKSEYEFSFFRKEERFTKQTGQQTLEKNPNQTNQRINTNHQNEM